MSRRPKSAARTAADAKKRGPRAPVSMSPAAVDAAPETDLRNEIAQALAQLEALEAEQTEFRATFDRAKAASGAELHTVQGALEQAERENRELAAALEAAKGSQTEADSLRDAHAAAVAEGATAREALAGLQARHAEAVRRIADLEQTLAETATRAQTDLQAETTRADDLALHAHGLAQALETMRREAELRFAELSARYEKARSELAQTDETLAHISRKLALADEDSARTREAAAQAGLRAEALAAEIVIRDEICAALRVESRDRQQQIKANEVARALVEERLRNAERRIAEADHAVALGDLRWQAWQGSAAGRLGRLLLRARRRWSALRDALTRTSANPLFDEAFYLASNPDVACSGRSPYRHYLDHGAREGRDPNPFFATRWYLKVNPDVAASGVNPLIHYYETGAAQLRDPHPDFSTRAWLDQHPDIAASGINPLEHFLRITRKQA